MEEKKKKRSKDNTLKNVYKGGFTVILLVFQFGFAQPFLISANSDFLVFLGFMLLFFGTPLYYLLWRKEIQKLCKEFS